MTVRRVLVGVLVAASVGFIAQQLHSGWSRISGESLPDPGQLALAIFLLTVGQVLIGEAFLIVGSGPPRTAVRRWAFHLTQPSKYIPAGVAQVAGLVAVLVGRGANGVATAAAAAVLMGSLVVGGISIGLVLSPALGWTPLIAVVGLLVPIALFRPVLAAIARMIGRVVPSIRAESHIPEQGTLFWTFAMVTVALALHAGAYAALVDAAGGDGDALASIAAYSLAFGVSIATPLPGGLGAREAILLGLTDLVGSPALVPIVLVRLLLIGIELVLGLTGSLRLRVLNGEAALP